MSDVSILKQFIENKRFRPPAAAISLGLLGGLLLGFDTVPEDYRGLVQALSIWLAVIGVVALTAGLLIGAWISRFRKDESAARANAGVPHTGAAKEEDETSRRRAAMYAMYIAVLMGLLFIIVFAMGSANLKAFVTVTSVGAMIAGASLLLGTLLGFLFGIPRTLQQDALTAAASQSQVVPDDTRKEKKVGTGEKEQEPSQWQGYAVNTNLEQISDWLTKILVGVGLTQITVMPGKMWNLAESLSVGLGDTRGRTVLALSIMIFFSVCGFLGGYLWTRLYLAGAFRRADTEDVAKLKKQTGTIEAKLDAHRQVMESDARAFSLALSQLNVDTPNIDQKDLTAAIKGASEAAQATIYSEAQSQRSRAWRTDKLAMERTIPLFRALCETRPESHQNHGQLGYALKDKASPALEEAINELNRAIDLRGPWSEKGYLLYELNRALARIQLKQEKSSQSSPPELRDLIVADLRVAASQEYGLDIIGNLNLVTDWMNSNGITLDDLLGPGASVQDPASAGLVSEDIPAGKAPKDDTSEGN